ncbi:MAG TPA: hypothetical protein VMR62_11880 [Bryobacteraceae bacterium]|nr:hypothetical protein [Bryobacteraceae bacterium]
MANLNSPAGILDPSTGDLLQPLVINSGNAQWITYSGRSAADPPAAVSFGIQGCTADPCTTTPLITGLGTSSYMWEWPASTPSPSFSFIQVTATDDAGNQGESLAPSTPSVFSFFDSNTAPNPTLTCSPSGGSGYVACTPLGGDDDIPTDPPSSTTQTACENPDITVAFSCYADPSMRADPLIVNSSNPYGTNLWMLYSFPSLQLISNPSCEYTPVVEIHLAGSNVSTGPGGNSWLQRHRHQHVLLGARGRELLAIYQRRNRNLVCRPPDVFPPAEWPGIYQYLRWMPRNQLRHRIADNLGLVEWQWAVGLQQPGRLSIE